MNINDVKEKAGVTGSIFDFICRRQKELMQKYHTIEEGSGVGYALVKGTPFTLNHRRWQYLLKDFAWRVTEEIGEALEAWEFFQISSGEIRAKHLQHVVEEFVDGLHFFVELLIIAGLETRDDIGGTLQASSPPLDPIRFFYKENPSTLPEDLYRQSLKGIQFLGMAMNCLKQKPWKQTEMLTDEIKFKTLLVRSFWFYIGIFKILGVSPEEIADFYYAKSEVNHFRQRSNY